MINHEGVHDSIMSEDEVRRELGNDVSSAVDALSAAVKPLGAVIGWTVVPSLAATATASEPAITISSLEEEASIATAVRGSW